MINDLISREALKRLIEDKIDYIPADDYDEGWNGAIYATIELVDNAPTVEPKYFPPCEDCNKKMEEIRQAYDKMKATERPQGEWIIVKDEKYGDNVKCPFCGKELAGTDLNFCCKCGAQMKGSEGIKDD